MRVISRLGVTTWMYAGLVLFTFGAAAVAILGYGLASLLAGAGRRQAWLEAFPLWALRTLVLAGVWWSAVLASRRPAWASLSPTAITVLGGGALACGVLLGPALQRAIIMAVSMQEDVANDIASLCGLAAFGLAVFLATFVRPPKAS